mmetsp:Transcript_10584/g.22250  ORF Transcript_10584/g.22250 Transcript_10584/m.22250 type:complete len:205 (-) Transcript_10584:434-1048(-)
MAHAGNELPARSVGQRHMSRHTPLQAVPLAHTALHLIGHLGRIAFQRICFGRHCQDLQVVELGVLPFGVHGEEDCVVHGLHSGLPLLPTELADDLQLLWHLLLLQVGRDELELKPRVTTAQPHEGVGAELFLGPLGEQGLQAEVGTHHGVAIAQRQPHKAHRRAALLRQPSRAAAPRRRPAAGEAIVSTARATFPVEDHTVGLN